MFPAGPAGSEWLMPNKFALDAFGMGFVQRKGYTQIYNVVLYPPCQWLGRWVKYLGMLRSVIPHP
jgi:hypothetical protein